jgi:vacuolar-type H+-ATPase subunit H
MIGYLLLFQLYTLLETDMNQEIIDRNGKTRFLNPNSLENLKLGAEARSQGKVRRNYTVLPETHEWLKSQGNASEMVDRLVEHAKENQQRHHGDWKALSARVVSEAEKERDELRQQVEALQQELERRAEPTVSNHTHHPKALEAIALLGELKNGKRFPAPNGGAIRQQALKALALLEAE